MQFFLVTKVQNYFSPSEKKWGIAKRVLPSVKNVPKMTIEKNIYKSSA